MLVNVFKRLSILEYLPNLHNRQKTVFPFLINIQNIIYFPRINSFIYSKIIHQQVRHFPYLGY